MPVYAYKCRDCFTPLELHQNFTDAPLTDCPECGGTLRKQYGSVGVTFNGSGFYRTDSRASAADKTGAAKTDGGAKTEAGGAKQSSTKADAPKPSAPAATAS